MSIKQVFSDPIINAQVEDAKMREAMQQAERNADAHRKAQPQPTVREQVNRRAQKDASLLTKGKSSWNVFQPTRNWFRNLGIEGRKYWPIYCRMVQELVNEEQPTRRLAFPDL